MIFCFNLVRKGGGTLPPCHVFADKLELGTCVLAINLFCDVLALVLFLLQTTYVLWVYFVYNLWVV